MQEAYFKYWEKSQDPRIITESPIYRYLLVILRSSYDNYSVFKITVS